MTYTDTAENETRQLLARITAERASIQHTTTATRPALIAAPSSNPRTRGKSTKSEQTEKAQAPRQKEQNITARPGPGGKVSYRVQIRHRVNGRQHSLCQTFQSLPNARKWRDRKLAEIEIQGFPVPSGTTEGPTVSMIIERRLESRNALGRSARQQLTYLRDHPFWRQTLIADLSVAKLTNFVEEMQKEDRTPQTVAGYMTMLAVTLKRAGRRGEPVPPGVVTDAMGLMWDEGTLARSNERERRPTLVELDKILSAIVENPRQTLPIATVVVFAIYSTRRISEICRLRWDDLNETDSKILVCEMKHPRKKATNNVWVALPPEAMRIIRSMPRTSDRIFPYDARSLGTAFRRHRDLAKVNDLRFHDLRHEGISRLFEMGQTAPFVKLISGHASSGCLERYTHVEKKGDKYDSWSWLDRVTSVHD